jgi:hypothetical protein
MSNQLQITGGAKVRNLEGVLTGTSGVVSSLGINVPSGIPQLDGSGKILVSQLPNSVMEYKGTWDASTNTPTLVDGTGNAGDVYLCNVAGTVNFGAGPITFYVGDQVLYSGTVWQRASGATGSVTSVALTESGDALNITGSPITTSGTINIGFNGTSGQYINGAGNLTTFPSLTGYVPYSGATQSVILGEWGLRSGYLSLDTTPTGTPTTVGTMSWDTTYLTPSVITGTGNTTLQIGQEEVVLIHNNTGSTLTDGQVVYINGSTGNLPTVALADASDESTSAATLGVVTETIANGSDGFITISGNVNGLNTTAYTAGDILWLSETAGQFTNVKPISPAHLVLIGYVVKVSGGNGSILVKIQNTQELEECSDVLFTSLTNNDVLAYESSTDLWKNKSIPTVLGYTPLSGGGTAGNIPYYTGTYTLGSENGFMYDSSTNRLGVNTTVPNATIGANASIDSGYSLLLKNSDSNYNGIGFGINTTYGNTFETQKLGVANAMNLTLLNQSGYISLTEGGNLGINILSPIASPSGVGSKGIDIYGDSQAASIGFHNAASGTGNTNGAYLYLTNTGTFTLRNLEGGIATSSLGDFSIITNSTENFRVNSSNGTIWQSNISDAMLKTVAGVLTAAVAGTDYVAPSALSGYVPTSRTISINGTTQDLSSNRSWSVGTLTGGGAASRVAFWDGASNVVSDSLFVWDDTNNRLGIGLTNPQRALEIYSASADTHLRLSGSAPSVSMGEAITGSIYQAKFGLATANNQFVTGSVAGDFVINNQTGATIWAYNSTEKMRLDTNGNLGIGGIANSSYRLHVFGTAPLLGIESTTTGNVALRFLQAGTVVSGITYFNSDSTLRITNNNGGVRIGTSGLDPALTIASTGAATFSARVTAYEFLASNRAYVQGTGTLEIGLTGSDTYLQSYVTSTAGNNNMLFFTGTSERMRITSGGSLLIGTTSQGFNPSTQGYLLGVKSNVGQAFISIAKSGQTLDSGGMIVGLDSSTGYVYLRENIALTFATNDTERMRLLSNGDIDLKSYGPNTNLLFKIQGGDTLNTLNNGSGTPMYLNYSGNGAIKAGSAGNTTLYAGSDYRIKQNINVVDSVLNRVLQLIPKTYEYKDLRDDKLYYGFIAQEVETIFPELVRTAEGISMCNDEEIVDQKSIESFSLVWASILTKAIQEQQAQIEKLEAITNRLFKDHYGEQKIENIS